MKNSTLPYNLVMLTVIVRSSIVLLTAFLAALGVFGCSSAPATPSGAQGQPPTTAPLASDAPKVIGPLASLTDPSGDDEDVGEQTPPATQPSAPDVTAPTIDASSGFPSYPLPDGNPPPLGPAVFGPEFRAPLPPSPVWDPPGPKRVGLQAGHWLTDNVPTELARLSPGTSAGGWAEWQVNLMIAEDTASILEDAGVDVDLLPSTIPVRYRAQAFVAIHADGDTSTELHGYKVTRSGFSSIPEADDQFVSDLNDAYGAATGMPRDDEHISRRMTYYYAFNTRRYQHALDLGTPAAIIEAGFLTNAGDRAALTNHPEVAARGIANGILRFLARDLGATQ